MSVDNWLVIFSLSFVLFEGALQKKFQKCPEVQLSAYPICVSYTGKEKEPLRSLFQVIEDMINLHDLLRDQLRAKKVCFQPYYRS